MALVSGGCEGAVRFPGPVYVAEHGTERRAPTRHDPGAWPLELYAPSAAARITPGLLPTDEPGLRSRVLDRLELEVRSADADLLVSSGEVRTGLALVLADRTGLPLLLPESPGAAPGIVAGSRVLLVGERLLASELADGVRTLEQEGATVAGVVGLTATDGEEMEMLSHHYNVLLID